MKSFFGNPYIHIAIVVLVAASVLFAGCASQPATPAASQPVSTAAPTVTGAGPATASLPFGVTVAVPSAWTRTDILTSDNRDYGTRAVRIATFTSPITVPGDA